MNHRGIRQILSILVIAAMTAILLPADDKKHDPDEIGNRKVDGRVNWYSMEKEIAMGKSYAMEIERQAKIVDDPIITEYVNRVGQNIVRNSDVKVPVSIKVLETDEPNAMALPGGFFFVNSGLLSLAEKGGFGHALDTSGKYLKDYQSGFLFGNQPFLRDHPETARSFVRTFFDARRFAQDHFEDFFAFAREKATQALLLKKALP